MKQAAVSLTKIITKIDNTMAMGIAIKMRCHPKARASNFVAYPLVAGAMVAAIVPEVGMHTVLATRYDRFYSE